MNLQSNLIDVLQVRNLAGSEVEHVLLNHFHGARQISATEIVYSDSETDYALKITYNDDVIINIEPGPLFKSSDLEALVARIQEDLLMTRGHRVGCVVLFARLPVRGAYRHGDAFQIVPVPAGAPTVGFAMGEHPFVLEFGFEASSDQILGIWRRMEIAREFELFLAGVVDGHIHSIGSSGRFHWVLGPDGSTQYRQEWYSPPEIKAERGAFTPTDEMPSIEFSEPSEYYTRRGISPGQSQSLPSPFPMLYNAFVGLASDDRQRFLRSCFWVQHAGRAHTHSRSAYFTALISAVEALMPTAAGESRCKECGRSLGPGPTARFVQFLEEHVPGGGELGQERRRLYAVRSALSHGGRILHADRIMGFSGFTPAHTKEWEDLSAAAMVVRVSLAHWLLSRNELPT